MALELLTNPEPGAASRLVLASGNFVNIVLGDDDGALRLLDTLLLVSAISSPINRFIFLPINFIPFF
jgi:hypothetical protein